MRLWVPISVVATVVVGVAGADKLEDPMVVMDGRGSILRLSRGAVSLERLGHPPVPVLLRMRSSRASHSRASHNRASHNTDSHSRASHSRASRHRGKRPLHAQLVPGIAGTDSAIAAWVQILKLQ